MTTQTTKPKFHACETLAEWAGLLSTLNFSALHPEEALQFLAAFRKWDENDR